LQLGTQSYTISEENTGYHERKMYEGALKNINNLLLPWCCQLRYYNLEQVMLYDTAQKLKVGVTIQLCELLKFLRQDRHLSHGGRPVL